MPPHKSRSGRSTLAIHPQRNLPSSLLRKRCEEKFAQVLHEYGESEGHPVEWALIIDSGRANKMLLISVYGKREFPISWVDSRGVRVSVGESDSEDEGEEGEGDGSGEDCEGEGKGEDGFSGAGEDGKRGELKGETVKSDDGEEVDGDDGKGFKKDDGPESDKADKKTDGLDPIFTVTETYNIRADSEDEEDKGGDASTPKPLTETYEIVGTVMNGEVQWMCDLPQYSEHYEDKTTYFKKDGLSMVHGVRFHDRIRERELAALAELEKMKAQQHEVFLAEQKVKKAAKKARQKAGLPLEHSDVEEDAADRKREKAKAKRKKQKQKRELALAAEADEEKAVMKAQEAAAKEFFKHHTGQELKAEDADSKIKVVDANTPEGALAIAQAKKYGAKIFPAEKIE